MSRLNYERWSNPILFVIEKGRSQSELLLDGSVQIFMTPEGCRMCVSMFSHAVMRATITANNVVRHPSVVAGDDILHAHCPKATHVLVT